MKKDEGRHFADLANDSIATLDGIGPHATAVLDALGVQTIRELAHYKYFLLSRALVTLAETEVENKRPPNSVMNIDKGVDKQHETLSLKEIIKSPVHVLEGLTDKAQDLLKQLGVKTVQDLGQLKYCRWAEAIVEVAKFEHAKTAAERHQERELKKLA